MRSSKPSDSVRMDSAQELLHALAGVRQRIDASSTVAVLTETHELLASYWFNWGLKIAPEPSSDPHPLSAFVIPVTRKTFRLHAPIGSGVH